MEFSQLAHRLLSFSNRELGSGVTEDEIERLETLLGVQIRGSYRHFLLQFGWAAVEHIEIYGLGEGIPEYLNLEYVTQSERTEMVPPLRRTLVPIMNDGAGNHYCLDCARVIDGENQVVLWDHEAGTDHTPQVQARSFAEWLSTKLDEL